MASGNLLMQIFPESYSPPIANAATPDVRLTASDQHTVLDFDATTAESAIYKSIMPPTYSGGAVNFALWCAMTSATTGAVVLAVAFERDNAQDLDTASFAADQTFAAVNVPAVNGELFLVTGSVTTGANMDSVLANDPFRIAIKRDPANVGDTASGDLEFWGGTIREA